MHVGTTNDSPASARRRQCEPGHSLAFRPVRPAVGASIIPAVALPRPNPVERAEYRARRQLRASPSRLNRGSIRAARTERSRTHGTRSPHERWSGPRDRQVRAQCRPLGRPRTAGPFCCSTSARVRLEQRAKPPDLRDEPRDILPRCAMKSWSCRGATTWPVRPASGGSDTGPGRRHPSVSSLGGISACDASLVTAARSPLPSTASRGRRHRPSHLRVRSA